MDKRKIVDDLLSSVEYSLKAIGRENFYKQTRKAGTDKWWLGNGFQFNNGEAKIELEINIYEYPKKE